MSASKLRQIISLDMPSSSCVSQAAQVENNRESTDRPYAAAVKARDLGYPDEGIVDEDLGLPGSRSVARSGLARLTPKWRSRAGVWCLVSKFCGSGAIMPKVPPG
jgi:hypothetical protein